MKLDVKNLAFGAVGQSDVFELSLDDYKIADDMIAVSLKGKIKLTRLDDSILAQIVGEAILRSECDRCLIEYDLGIPFSFSKEFFLGGYRENDEDLLVSKHFEINIEDTLREEVVLALPVQRLCKRDCKGLCQQCGADLNAKRCNCSKR